MPSSSKKKSVTPECLRTEGYQLHELLGEGSYSNVYRATKSDEPGVNFACKLYKINPKTIKWVERCLHRELILAMKVRHRSIVQAFTAIRAGDQACLIIQYASKGSIRDYLRKKLAANVYLAEHKVRALMFDIFSAVAYLHGQEIAHRDIKTDNFLLNEDMQPLLADFSYACISDKPSTRFECMVDTVCGTPSYLAPEVHSLPKGNRYDAKLSDVYSLGICLFEMHVKQTPYRGKVAGQFKLGNKDLVKRQMARDYEYPSKIQMSKESRELIYRLLDPSPRNRMTIKQALSDTWFTKRKIVSSKKSSSKKATDSSEIASDNFRKQFSSKDTKTVKTSKSNKSKPAVETPEASDDDSEEDDD